MNATMKLVSSVLLLLTLCRCAWATTPIFQCPSQGTLPLSVQFGDCDSSPCNWSKGQDYHMNIQFVATKDMQWKLRANVRLTTIGAMVPFELEESRAIVCNNLLYGAYCPLYTTEDVTYDLKLKIEDNAPEVLVTIEVNLWDENDGGSVACFRTKAQITRLPVSKH